MKSVVLALGSVALSAAAWLCIGTRTMPVLAVSATGIAAVGYGTTKPRFRSSQKFLDEQRKLEESKKQLELSRSEYEFLAVQLNNQKLAFEQANKLLSQEQTQLKETQNKLAIKEEELAQLSNNLSDTDVKAKAVTQLQRQLATLEDNLTNKQNYLNNLEKEVLATKEHLEEQLQYVYQNRAELVQWCKDLAASEAYLEEREINYQTKLESDQAAMWADLQGQAQGLAQQLAQGYYNQQLEQLQTWAQRLAEQQESVNNALASASQEWSQQFQQLEVHYQGQVNETAEECNARIQAAQQSIVQAQEWYQNIFMKLTKDTFQELHQLKQPLMPPPQMYEEQPKAAMIGERVLKFLYDKQIYVDYIDSYEEKGGISLLVRCKKGASEFVETYNAIGKQLPAIASLAPGCSCAPQYGIHQGNIRIDFDMSGMEHQTRSARARSKQIDEMPDHWLEEVIKYTYHFRVNGPTRAGKSTFVNNLIGLLKRLFGEEVEIILIDPKYPMSQWSLKPRYKGLEESILGLQAMAEDVQTRLKLATEDADAGRPIRSFKKTLYILDEADTVAGEYNDPTPPVAEFLESLQLTTKKAVAHLLKQGLKVGAALGVAVCYIGQSPLCSTLGMNKNDFNHSANFFLGENIPQAINDIAMKHQQPYLLQQYRLRIERYMEAKGTEEEKPYKYFALVKVPGESPFLATLPPEGFYDEQPQFVPVGAGVSDLDPDNPNDVERFTKLLEASVGKSSQQVEEGQIFPWDSGATPSVLVESARVRIISLIHEGVEKPADICRLIWGDINVCAKPYNGKAGVKKRIETIISEVKR